MVQLTRQGKLLGTVGGKPHATQADHYDVLPTPPASTGARSSDVKDMVEEDVTKSPESTDDEGVTANGPTSRGGWENPRQLDGSGDMPEAKSAFRIARSLGSPQSTRSKRSAEESEDDSHIFPSSQRSPSVSPNKKLKAGMGNIHAPAFRKPKSTYSRKGSQASQNSLSQPSRVLQKPAELPKLSPPKGPAFKQAVGADLFAFKGNDSAFKSVNYEREDSRSPSLSSGLSDADSDIEQIDATQFNLPDPTPYIPKAKCHFCNTLVPLLVRQAFNDKYPKAKGQQYKYQKWFCNYHKVVEAQTIWEQRRYPEIEWSKLDRRLKRHHKHLINVLEGKTPSVYRERLQEQVDAGGGKSALAALATSKDNDSEQGLTFTPGYYGPRGEKLVMEHVSSHFSDRLRELAKSDPLIAAVGVKGGVSGFTQGVLVPELVVSLVMEDLKVGAKRAREALQESKDLGELLSDEVGEKVSTVIEVDG